METIITKNVCSQWRDDIVRYSIETNRRRAFPDFKDGLKLCHRRILFVMAFVEQCRHKLVKTAQVSGTVMGQYHPHGDSSVNDAIPPLSNWFDTYMPLVYSESNMGNMQGKTWAAPRYTEVMLSEFALETILKDMIEVPEVVDWTWNYAGDRKEPEYLSAAVPLLLINGTWGLGTGRSVSIPPHNITEVLDATINLIDNPDAPVVLVPDQCMPCEIIEANWTQISNTGSGTFKVRGIIDTEVMNKGTTHEHYALVIKSVPDDVTLDNGKDKGVLLTINGLISDGKLPQIVKIDQDSHDTDMRIVLHLKKGADPGYVRDYLYKVTKLQTTQTVNFEVLDDIDMVRMSYKEYIQAFIYQRKITKFRMYCLKLQEVRTNIHEKEICIKVIKSGKINEIIKKIQKCTMQNEGELIEWLIKLLDVTDLQAKFILNYPTKKFAPMYLAKYEAELAKYREREAGYLAMIVDDDKIEQEIRGELVHFKNKYGFPRKCKVLTQASVSNIPKGAFNVVITENNYIKKLPISEAIGSYKGDNPIRVIRIDNTSDLILITAQGRMFRVPVHKIPITEKNSIGVDIRILLKGVSSNIVDMFDYNEVKQFAKLRRKYYAVICTRNNYIKKIDLDDLLIATAGGVILTKLNDGDTVQEVQIIPDDIDVVIYSQRKALRCHMTDIPNYKRNTLGVYAMNTKDQLDGISAIDPSVTDIVTITNSGRINKISVSALPVSDRYKAGSNVIKLGKNDSIHSLFGAKDSDIIHITTKNTKIDINVVDVPQASSVSTGTKMVPMKGDRIVSTLIEY